MFWIAVYYTFCAKLGSIHYYFYKNVKMSSTCPPLTTHRNASHDDNLKTYYDQLVIFLHFRKERESRRYYSIFPKKTILLYFKNNIIWLHSVTNIGKYIFSKTNNTISNINVFYFLDTVLKHNFVAGYKSYLFKSTC